MSRTDKTDPYFVKLNRYGVEHHDHRSGTCDYHSVPKQGTSQRPWSSGVCERRMPHEYWWDSNLWGQAAAVRQESTRQNRVERRNVKAALASGDYDSVPKQGTGRSQAIWDCC